MATRPECSYNLDPLKLVREGTGQDRRLSAALEPGYAAVNERRLEHSIVFAGAYSRFLKYYRSNNAPAGNWEPFFTRDISFQLAGAALEDVDDFRRQIKTYTAFLNDRQNDSDKDGLRRRVDFLFSSSATLAIGLDNFIRQLSDQNRLQPTLRQLVRTQLEPAFRRLIAYRKGGETIVDAERPLNDPEGDPPKDLRIFGQQAVKWSILPTEKLSTDWTGGPEWGVYYAGILPESSVYGTGTTVFERVNHLATHNLFTSVFDQFLMVYARTVAEAKQEFQRTLMSPDHEPHYALFLSFLSLFEHAKTEANTLTGRHLDFYYRRVLGLKEKPAEPGHAHLLVELARQVSMYELKGGELFKAGKDDRGIDAFFANDRDVVVNQAKVAALKTVYRHGKEPVGSGTDKDLDTGRLYASPVANSDDGLGAQLTSADLSWHPFYNKIYADGVLTEIRMPKAEIGFVIASHYLWMAGGTRTITVRFTLATGPSLIRDWKDDVLCLLTTEKGWIEKAAQLAMDGDALTLSLTLTGGDPPVTSFSAKTHGYGFGTNLPVLFVRLPHQDKELFPYHDLQDVAVSKIILSVHAAGLKSIAVSNDFGPVDASKPFQPFGSQPVNGASFTVGSKELFEKNPTTASVEFEWQNPPSYYKSAAKNDIEGGAAITDPGPPGIGVSYLVDGQWKPPADTTDFTASTYALKIYENSAGSPSIDLSENDQYSTASRYGYVRLVFQGDLGFEQYQKDLANYLAGIYPKPDSHPGAPILGPVATEVSVTYDAVQDIPLNSTSPEDYETRRARFFHVAPFGHAEQHPVLSGGSNVSLLPQFTFNRDGATFTSEAEFYVGIAGLTPPQNVALLFQVTDGTANPLAQKPDPHLDWSYLSGNRWITLSKTDVDDRTGGLLNSGIVTLAIPSDASESNTLLSPGMHWLRVAVATKSDAVCRLVLVAAQAVRASFTDRNNDAAFAAKVLPPGTIAKLAQPDAAVKMVTQPFASFGGKGAEAPTAFYTRVSERLRHKDRAIALWDYERLILEAFPQIHRAKCLNHTEYEPTEDSVGTYRELAPGHVTVVTIPDQRFQKSRDPLRPYTSLGLLDEIGQFVRKRLSCFVALHVKNPEFEEVQVQCLVRLREGFDETFYKNKLGEALTRFLSPWAFTDGGYPSFGGKIYKAVLINFVEDQPYVDYVTDFKLFHTFLDQDGASQTSESNEVEGSKAVSILVSAPRHGVTVITPVMEAVSSEKCPCEP
jgi:hypothetical protein